jgi:hypothetical protein
MTFADLNFEDSSQKIVSEFLHSVVVVDDRASLNINSSEELVQPETVTALVKPSRKKAPPVEIDAVKPLSRADEKIKEKIPDENKPPIIPQSLSGDLDAKKLIDTFADKGLVCAVLKPIEHEPGLNEKTDHATHKSDIVILDWQIGDNEEKPGAIALGLIKKIISTDSKDRLRLIAIYTSNPDLNSVAQQIASILTTEHTAAVTKGFEISRGPVKIVIYQKSGGNNTIAPERVVKEEELPDKLINDFTNLTKGLLSNVALRSLGTLRENTHRILNKFSSEIDSSYITHRVLNNPPDEAENHPVPLVASELLDVLEDCNVRDLVSDKFIEKWLDYKIGLGLTFTGAFKDIDHDQALELVKMLLKTGIENQASHKTNKAGWDAQIKKLSNKFKESKSFLTGLFSLPETANVMDLDMDFAILTTIRSKYEYPTPLLTLGSIVSIENGLKTEYYFCIQPLCDSVRLTEPRKFSFIPLTVSDKDKFHLVVKDNGGYVKLLTDLRPYNTLMIGFDAKDKGEILANKTEKGWIFKSADESTAMRWVADLKFPHAQRIITQYSEQLGRVGLTESDWLRRMAK